MSYREDDIYIILFRLAQSSLWGDNPEITNYSFYVKDILQLAEEQTIYGLIFEEIVKHDIKIEPPELFDRLGIVENIKHQNLIENKILCDFCCNLNEYGVEALVVKGQTIACLYPNPQLRMSGDIDYLIKEELSYPQIL